MKFYVPVEFDIDEKAWADDHGLTPDEVRDDVLSAIARNMEHLQIYLRNGGWRALDGIATVTAGQPSETEPTTLTPAQASVARYALGYLHTMTRSGGPQPWLDYRAPGTVSARPDNRRDFMAAINSALAALKD